MTVPFNNIPSNLRVPLFYAEVDNSQANQAGSVQRTLIMAQMLSTGNATANALLFVSTLANAITMFGQGSMLARMYEIYRGIDPFGEIWCVGVADADDSAQATGSVALTGPATAAGTINLYLGGQLVAVGVLSGDTADTIGANVVAAVNADADLPVTAAYSTGTLTFSAKHGGTLGNDIQIQLNYGGLAAGETTPAGVGAVITAMSAGATDPTLTTPIANIGDEVFDAIVHPWTDSTSLDAFKNLMQDASGRWSYIKQIYGHVWSAKRGTSGALITAGTARNDQHHLIAGFEANVPNPCWEFAAAYAAACVASLRIDPARPTQTLQMIGILPAPSGQQFMISERQSLLSAGIATSYYDGGYMCVERDVTTYQLNAQGQPDDSYLDTETMYTTMYVLTTLKTAITSKYGRSKLANDGTRFAAGAAIVTPNIIRGEILAQCYLMETAGILENIDVMAKYLIVERNATNPNRLDVLFPPDYVNQLRIFALLNQFRLQYPANA